MIILLVKGARSILTFIFISSLFSYFSQFNLTVRFWMYLTRDVNARHCTSSKLFIVKLVSNPAHDVPMINIVTMLIKEASDYRRVWNIWLLINFWPRIELFFLTIGFFRTCVGGAKKCWIINFILIEKNP